MILTGDAIAIEVSRGRISIDPFDLNQVNPNSYNYRLGSNLVVLDQDGDNAEICIPSTGFVLQPKQVYLGSTVERIGSSCYVPTLIGRSSLGRLGVFAQISADLGNLGPAHCWTLEIVAVQPVRVYGGMRFGQVAFWVPLGDIGASLSYTSVFVSAHHPMPTPAGFHEGGEGDSYGKRDQYARE